MKTKIEEEIEALKALIDKREKENFIKNKTNLLHKAYCNKISSMRDKGDYRPSTEVKSNL